MYDFMLLEMAEAISIKCGTRIDDAMNALIGYWQDKIAHVWQVGDMLETARRAGKPITRTDAIELLKSVFDNHDSSLGITWQTLDVALEDYHLEFASLPAEKYGEVHGVFNVWREHNPVAHQFGVFPNKVDGYFLTALEFAQALAREHSGQTVFVGCESSAGEDAKPWLILQQEENETISITESEVLNHVRMD